MSESQAPARGQSTPSEATWGPSLALRVRIRPFKRTATDSPELSRTPQLKVQDDLLDGLDVWPQNTRLALWIADWGGVKKCESHVDVRRQNVIGTLRRVGARG